MKKITTVFFVVLLLFAFASCGTGYAKIVGCEATIGINDNAIYYDEDYYTIEDNGDLYCKNESVTEINLSVGKEYLLRLDWIVTGGSKCPGFTYGSVKSIEYDENVLTLKSVCESTEEEYARRAEYVISCDKETKGTKITVKTGEYELVITINFIVTEDASADESLSV